MFLFTQYYIIAVGVSSGNSSVTSLLVSIFSVSFAVISLCIKSLFSVYIEIPLTLSCNYV